jgi:predicted nucleotidyltransferase component of viral defense system
MANSSQRPLDARTHREVAEVAQALILQGLAAETSWTMKDAVFQGGTSLALAWGSKRFSEDLDFLVARKLDLSGDMRKVARYLQGGLQRHFPGALVQVKDKLSEDKKGGAIFFSIQLPDTIGTVRVKSDFWRVSDAQVQSYGAEYRSMRDRFDVRPFFSVARPEQVYADKLHAIGSRPYLKWRDLYDLWHIETDFPDEVGPFWREGATLPGLDGEPVDFAVWQMAQQLSLYSESTTQFVDGLKRFAATPVEELVAHAGRDLKPWLPAEIWLRMWPDQVALMATNALARAGVLAMTLALNIDEFTRLHRALLDRTSESAAEQPTTDHGPVEGAAVGAGGDGEVDDDAAGSANAGPHDTPRG